MAAATLEALGVSPQEVAAQARELLDPGPAADPGDPVDPGGQSGHIPFTPGAKQALQLARREAIELRHEHIGTEHIPPPRRARCSGGCAGLVDKEQDKDSPQRE